MSARDDFSDGTYHSAVKEPADAPGLVLPDVPYRGIKPFQFADQMIFAAREKEVWTLFSKVTLYPAVLLYGDSGSGKSSLINAGLLPYALKENYVPNRLRVQPLPGREIKVEQIRKLGGPEPIYLPSSFGSRTESTGRVLADEDESFELSLTSFRRQLRQLGADQRDPQSGNGDAAPAADPFELNGSPRDGSPRALLVFDQFEEFITLFEEAQRGPSSTEAKARQEQVAGLQRRILVTLVKLIRNPDLPVKIVFAFREDYLAKLSVLFEHCPELVDQAQRLLPPAAETLSDIILAPFADQALRTHFLEATDKRGSEIDRPLADQISQKLSEGGEVNLTELQIVCLRLWLSDAPKALFDEVGIQGLVEDYGEEVVNGFPFELRQPAIMLLARMITQSNTRNIVEEGELIAGSKLDNVTRDLFKRALDALVESQLVRRETRRNIYFYEITSEYLVPWIRRRQAERESTISRDRVQDVLKELPSKLRPAAVALLGHLLTRSNTRTVVSENDLITQTSYDDDIPSEQLVHTINLLAQSGLVRRELRRTEYFYEISSEYLVPWIREVVTGRDSRHRLAEQRLKARRERQRAQRFQRLLFAFCLLVVGLISLGAFAGYLYKRSVQAGRDLALANHQKQVAEAVAKTAEKRQDQYEAALNVVAGKEEDTKLKAIAKIDEWTREKDFPAELTLLLVVVLSKTNEPRVKEALSQVVDPQAITAAEGDESLALPPRFDIHIADDRQRPSAIKLAAALRERGWVVPSIQVAAGDSPYWDNELRYFRKSEEIAPPVPDILSVLGKSTNSTWVDKFVSGYANSPKVRSGYFEIWFAAPKGVLFVDFLDEEGNQVRGLRTTLRFVPRDGSGLPFSKKRKAPGFIDVPPGNYDVTISVSGYQDTIRNLMIDAHQQVSWADLRLTK